MPYICLTRTDIPDGTLQILDLLPNASQRHPGYDPPAQTRYVNRVQNEALALVNGVSNGIKNGLSAYILDRIEPGGTQVGTAEVDLDAPGVVLDPDTITIGGVVFTATDVWPPDPALQFFSSDAGAGSDETVMANSLIDAVNDPASQVLLLAAGGTCTASAGGSLGAGQVLLTADTAGATGALTLAESTAGARIDITDDHLSRTFEDFTARQIANISERIIIRLDAASALTATDVNTAINAEGGVTGCDIASVGTLGSLIEMLSILAGRGYRLPHFATIYTGAGYDIWHSAAAGSFDISHLVNDSRMVAGELVPNNIGGDTALMPVKGITNTYHSSALEVSLLEGDLSKMGAGITLWPDSDDVPHFPWTYQKGTAYSTVTARVVTVYDDDGTVLV